MLYASILQNEIVLKVIKIRTIPSPLTLTYFSLPQEELSS